MRETAATAARKTIAELCDSDLDADELLVEVAERVGRVVPFDTGAWMMTDPINRLPTHTHSVNSPPELGAAYCQAEISGTDDVNGWDAMFERGTHAASLADITGGRLDLSSRYREIHQRFGLRDEMRMVAGSGGSTWAYACLARAEDVPDFTPEEIRFVSSVASLLGQGIRSALVRAPTTRELVAPGMIVLGPELEVEAATGEAVKWLAGMREST